MKDAFLSRRRRPNQPKKLKLVCSFNGTFHARPPSGKLRYTGGETRIVSVDRNIGFSRLKSKISELLGFCPNNGLSFSLKYQFPVEDDDSPLVVITTEDDVRRMIDEYDKLESHGKPTRLWIFVCNDNGYVHRKRTENNISVNFFETENLNDGSGVSCKNSNGFGGDSKGTHNVNRISCPVNINEFESRNSMTHLCGGEFGSGEVQNSAMSANGARFDDDSLRKRVQKQQLLANQQSQIRSFHRVSGLAAEQTEMEFTSENKKFDQPLIDLTSERQGPVSHGTTDLKFGGNPYRANVLYYEYRNTQIQRNDNLGIHSLPVSQFHPLYPRDGNSHVETNSFMQGLINRSGPILSNGAATGPAGSSQFVAAAQFPKQFCDYNMDMMPTGSVAKYELRSDQPAPLSNLDRKNVTPWSANCGLIKNGFAPLSCSNQLVGNFYPAKSSYGSDRVWGDLHSGIHNHRFTATGTRNQRTSPYHLRNHRNSFTEIGSHRNARLERRPWVGKCYPGLRSSLNISKQGQAMRSYYPSLWKPWSGYHGHTPEGIGKMMGSGLNYQAYLCDQVYGSKENFTNKRGHELPQPQAPHFAYNGANTGMYDQSLLPTNVTKNALKSSRAMDAHEDLLTCSNGEKHEVPRQAPCKTLHRAPTSSQTSCDFKKESQLMEPMEATIDIPGSPRNLCLRKGTELGCNGKLSTIESCVKSFSNHHGGAHAIQGGLASSVDLSLCNLSLSSSKEFEPPAHPAPTSNDISEDLLKPQSKPLELMDEEQLSSGPQVETSNGVASDSSLQNAAKLEKVDERKEEMQQDHPSSLSIEKKADMKESHKCSNANGSIPNNLAAFYSHLASRELQAIKNSDLEYIKELGSGTYGTVFYGKWKGCDVAIKKLKPSCFTEGAPEQDRLVADFWKEARILGQLHHPHIVAFYGVVTDGPVTNLATVTEYMVNGSLKQVLQRKDRIINQAYSRKNCGRSSTSFTWSVLDFLHNLRTIDRRKRLIVAMDAAFGMEYLHEKNIVHFDLKSHNFLVNMKDPQRPVCKIGDLGLSKIKQRTLVSGGVRGTIPWMAPELLNCKKNMVTEKVDVYSFGIVMWELLTGEEPYGNMRSKEIIAGIIEGNLRPEIPSWCDPAWRSLMERCWSSDPNSRPGFSEIAKELRAMSAAMNIK